MIPRRTILSALIAAPLLGVAAPSPASTAATVVFVAAHQDDELLFMGSSIVSHVQSGHNVIVVPSTDGRASRARSTLSKRLGREVTEDEFVTYRDAEMRWTVRTGLRARFEVPPPGIRQRDGESTLGGTRAVLEWVLETWPGARIKTHTPWDTHLDHRSLGVVATDMHYEGLIPDLRLYTPGHIYRQNLPDLPAHGRVRRWEAVNAQAAYKLWSPPKPGTTRDRYYQIGWTSVARLFREHAADPISRFHAPVEIPARLREGLV